LSIEARTGRLSDKKALSMNKRIFMFATALLVLLVFGLPGQIKTCPVTRTVTSLPVIDGRPDDPAWAQAEWIGGFVQQRPDEGRPPTQETAFKIFHDETSLYILIRAFDTEPERIDRRLLRRDDYQSDHVLVFIDSQHDHRTAFLFLVTASGIKCDGVVANDDNPFRFVSDGTGSVGSGFLAGVSFDWNRVWSAATRIDGEGWTAEIIIPFSQLRINGKGDMTWGIQIGRYIQRNQEISFWQPIANDFRGFVSRFGHATGLRDIARTTRVEAVPYAVGKLLSEPIPGSPSPLFLGMFGLTGGLDARVGLSNGLALDLTVNPDFGQVEADPSVVNLTAYETFFEEKRPFFVEGKEILEFALPSLRLGLNDDLFYSRRIGGPPHGRPLLELGEREASPLWTSILLALKLTGKTAGGLSLGALECLTSQETAAISGPDGVRRVTVEPLSNYFVGRIQKDGQNGNLIIGTTATAVLRRRSTPGPFALPASASTAAFDLKKYWRNKSYALRTNAVLSWIQGEPDALLAVQRSSVHTFQRPDADHLKLDASRTSLFGHGGLVEFGKVAGNVRFSTCLTWRSPGLELNDVGFLQLADMIRGQVAVSHATWKPFWIFRETSVSLNLLRGWDFGREKTDIRRSVFIDLAFKNRWRGIAAIRREDLSVSPNDLRGGPSLLLPAEWGFYFLLSTDPGRKLAFEVWPWIRRGDEGSLNVNGVTFESRFRPLAAFEIVAGPSIIANKQKLQYVTTRDFGLEKRFLCASLDQKTVSCVFRLNCYLKPNLSVQFYGQPFISSGDFFAFKKIVQPKAQKFAARFYEYSGREICRDPGSGEYLVDEDGDGLTDFSFGDPDFNSLQFNSNFVFRWEFRPGSCLYLVWSQNRTGVLPMGDFRPGERLPDLFGLAPRDVFLVKFSYWFSI